MGVWWVIYVGGGRFGVRTAGGRLGNLEFLCFGVMCCGGGVEDLDRTYSAVAGLGGCGRGYVHAG